MTRLKVTVEKQADVNLLVDFFKEKGIKYQIYDDADAFKIKNVLKEDEVAYERSDIVSVGYDTGDNISLISDDQDEFVYTDEIKKMLDEREADYLSGKDVPITAEESRKRIDAILNRIR